MTDAALLDSRQQAVGALLGHVRDVATLPSIAIEVNRLADDPMTSTNALVDLISHDQALTARVIRVANSALFGCQGTIGSLDRAVFVLGSKAVRNIAIAASLSTLFRGVSAQSPVSPADLWRHALGTAIASGLLARDVAPAITGEAFVAGMLHDVGLTAELQFDRQRFQSVVSTCADGSCDLRQAELDTFGATHEDFGSGLLRKWKLPEVLVSAAAAHHEPWHFPIEDRLVPTLVHVADWMGSQCGLGFTLDVNTSRTPDDDVLSAVGLTMAMVERHLGELSTAVVELETALRTP
jgi:HD-like signal output (HDOD) protein